MRHKFDINEFNALLIMFSAERDIEPNENETVDEVRAMLTRRLYRLSDYLRNNELKLVIVKDE